ncbi:TPA: DNA cytosine methyltransferase [Stenotrophomonas maltophilia]|nr:DNA cytosine methyltransferase [Stenotrophomonas maltophilia]
MGLHHPATRTSERTDGIQRRVRVIEPCAGRNQPINRVVPTGKARVRQLLGDKLGHAALFRRGLDASRGVRRCQYALAAASLVKFRGTSDGADAGQPMPTITSGAGAARPAGAAHAMGVMAAFLEQANGGFYQGAGSAADEPMPTICANGSHQRLTTAHLVTLRRNLDGQTTTEPLSTICAGATHHGVIECVLSPEQEAGALRVAAFLMRYYGTGGQHGDLGEPLATITTTDWLALVTVHLSGVPYVIVDIGLRMLKPHELFRPQGFPASYIIDRTQDGRQVSNSRAVAMVGNSVSPPPLVAILEANTGKTPRSCTQKVARRVPRPSTRHGRSIVTSRMADEK